MKKPILSILIVLVAQIHISYSQCNATTSTPTKPTSLGLVIYSNDVETVWNALRFANFSLSKGDTVAVFLLGKGVELDNLVKSDKDIGKGKEVEGFEIIKINLKISDIVKSAHKYKDEDYISLEVSKLQNTDNFGHDYTAYVNRLEEEKVSEPAANSKKQTRKSKAAKQKASESPF